MKTHVTVLMLIVAGLVVAGCDAPPPPPRMEGGQAIGGLIPLDAQEAHLVQQFADAEVDYLYRLQVLQSYYDRTGAYAKARWAQMEHENVQQARTFEFIEVRPAEPATAPSLDQVGESTLAEDVVAARHRYLQTLGALYDYYLAQDQGLKASLVDNIGQRFDPVRTFSYFLDAEVPPADLRPTTVVPGAEQLFRQAVQLYREARSAPLRSGHNQAREALAMFEQLVHQYPNSTRIAESAFHVGEIYRLQFRQPYRAVLWYERSWQWDPALRVPSRFHAARISDVELHNRSRAVELYREVLRHESFNPSNQVFAQRRLHELTREPGMP